MPHQNDTLYLGLCLAGAVSAGAYTAGVMDYLLETLDEWEKRRGQDGVPTHKVIIPAIGGASAGGMTGIITSAMIHEEARPIKSINGDLYREFPDNKLYHSWVDMLQMEMFPLLLDNSDIQEGVHSLLNSDFIDKIAERAMKVDNSKSYLRPYIDPHLKVFTTLTNLKGLPYSTDFIGTDKESAYHYTRHSDFAAFQLNEEEYRNDGWIPLDYFSGMNVNMARDAAMATGAFPLGLKAREFKREAHFINDFKWNEEITRYWPLPEGQDETICVDGGVINNEPFYKVMNMLEVIARMKAEGREEPSLDEVEAGEKESSKILGEANKTMDSFNYTTIMIDPFPSTANDEFKGDTSLLSVAGNTLKAMLDQVRLKPDSLIDIFNNNDPSLFLIAPVRYMEKDGIERKLSGARALACGFMGGFGGFLHKEFRVHDFFLGRANCEWFLREYLTVPKDCTNPIFKNGYKDVKDLKPFLSRDGKRLQMIPVFSERKPKPYLPVFENGAIWPWRKEEDVDRYKKAVKQRAGAVAIEFLSLKGVPGYFAKLAIQGWLGKKVLNHIKKEMRRWQLLEK